MMTELQTEKSRPSVKTKVQELLGKLDATSGREKQPQEVVTSNETIADDAPELIALRESITQYESVVRKVLALMGVNYDELIRMDNNSPYAQAVNANPMLLTQVAQSKNPVLSALQIAMQFKPYAEFASQYGNTPDAVKKAIRDEVMAEVNADSAKTKTATNKANRQQAVFSTGEAGNSKPKAKNKDSLHEIFNK